MKKEDIYASPVLTAIQLAETENDPMYYQEGTEITLADILEEVFMRG